jgi:hypothetical protein
MQLKKFDQFSDKKARPVHQSNFLSGNENVTLERNFGLCLFISEGSPCTANKYLGSIDDTADR